jgi:hypothetical protein
MYKIVFLACIFLTLNQSLVLASCSDPGVDSKYCKATLIALSNGNCQDDTLGDTEISLCEEFKIAWNGGSCDSIFDYFGHCDALSSFKRNECKNLDSSNGKVSQIHQILICKVFEFAKSGGKCKSLQIERTRERNLRLNEIAGICRGAQLGFELENENSDCVENSSVTSKQSSIFRLFKVSSAKKVKNEIKDASYRIGLELEKLQRNEKSQLRLLEKKYTKKGRSYTSIRNLDLEKWNGVGFIHTNEDVNKLEEVIQNQEKSFPKKGIYLSVGGERSCVDSTIFRKSGLEIERLIIIDTDKEVLDFAEKLCKKKRSHRNTAKEVTTIQINLNQHKSWAPLIAHIRESKMKIAVLDLSNVRQESVCPRKHKYPGNGIDRFIDTLKENGFFSKNAMILETRLDVEEGISSNNCYPTDYLIQNISN